MRFDPKIYLQTAAILTLVTSGAFVSLGESDLASGVILASLLLMLNLWGWIWSIKTFIRIVKEGGSSALFTVFTTMKFTVLATTLIAVFYLFGGLAIIVANSILVGAMLLPTLYFAILHDKGLSNGF